jgi:hypothetical protein
MVPVLAIATLVGWALIAVAIWLWHATSSTRHADSNGSWLLKVVVAWLIWPLAVVASVIAIPFLWVKWRRIRADEGPWLRGDSTVVDSWLGAQGKANGE